MAVGYLEGRGGEGRGSMKRGGVTRGVQLTALCKAVRRFLSVQSTCAPCSTRSSATSECPGVTTNIKGVLLGWEERGQMCPPPLMPHPSPPVHVHTVNVGGVGDVSEHDLDCVLVAIP